MRIVWMLIVSHLITAALGAALALCWATGHVMELLP